MLNDDVSNKAINIEIKVAQYSAKAILKAMKKIMEDEYFKHLSRDAKVLYTMYLSRSALSYKNRSKAY
jgi:hypothetical protein